MATNGVTNGVHTNGVHSSDEANIISPEDFAQREYDYLILGGGTAGLVIAARLSENADVTVGVIEAGKNKLDDMFVDVPALFPQMFNNPEYDWAYMTTPQVGVDAAKKHHFVRGKMLGGSSAINYMMYVRGSTADYDDWAKIVEDDSWSAANMKQYMRKHQMLEPIGESVTDRSTMPFVGENHGTSGPVHTSFNPWKLDIEDDVVKAADKVTGYAKKPMDPWSGDHIGFYHTLASISRSGKNTGKRSHAARGYLEANFGRPNLKVTTEALVTKIELEGNTATGATYRSQGKDYTVRAKREVIVCGGTIASPQILELSGIGNPDILSKAGVECKIENRGVGENMQDHVVAAIVPQLADGVEGLDILYNPEKAAEFQGMYFGQQGAGPLSTTSTVQGFFPYKKFATAEEQAEIIKSIESIDTQTPFAKKQRDTIIAHLKDDQSANLQFVFVPLTSNMVGSDEDQAKLWVPVPAGERHAVTLAACLQYPVSRGHVHIRSSNPEDHPDIDPAYFKHEADLNVLAAGIKFLHLTSQAEPFASKLNGGRKFPSADLDLTKTEDAKKAVLEWYMTEYHPCGSVAMGDALDSRLRVKGVNKLRVADASIFPGHVSGNIVSSVYMVGERAADIIKEDWDYAALKAKG